MTEDKDKGKENNLRVVEFSKPTPTTTETPDYIVETLEFLLTSAKEGNLRNFIAHYDFIDDNTPEGQLRGGSTFWNASENALEVVGIIELMKSIAMTFVHEGMHFDLEDE